MASDDVEMAPSPPSSEVSLMSTSADEQPWHQNIKNKLWNCLAATRYVGEFMSNSTSQINADPGLHIHNVGNISLPLRPEDATKILNTATQAPFGRGSKTIVDKSFRNTKQLDPDSFQIRNPAWTDFLEDIIRDLGVDLGYPDSPTGITAELHKLLLYEKGAMFKPHKDSEKKKGMFATLVICLPSKHEGGEIVFNHHGDERIVRTSEESEFGQTHIAWYADVLHEIKPVNAGYRLVLTYNLIRTQTQSGVPTSAQTIVRERQMLKHILQEWKRYYEARQEMENKLVYFLDHDYSEANLCYDNLKGRDRLVGRYVKEACAKEGFTMLFANLDLQYTKNEDDEEPEETDKEWRLNHLVYPDGRVVLDIADLCDEELLQGDRYGRYADRTTNEDTGNEGTETTYFYHDTVMILMPTEYLLEFRLKTLTIGSIVKWMQGLMDEVRCSSSESAKEELVRICLRESTAVGKRRISFDLDYTRPHVIWEQSIKASQLLQDPGLLFSIAQGCARYETYSSVYEAFAGCISTFGFTKIRPCFDELVPKTWDGHCKRNDIFASFRDRFEFAKSNKTPLKDWTKYVAWEKCIIKHLLGSCDGGLYEYTARLLTLIEWYSKDYSIKNVLPYLTRNTTATTMLVAFLAGLSVAVNDGKLLTGTAEPFFGKLIIPTVSGPSLHLLRPTANSPKEPCWWSLPSWQARENPASQYQEHLGEEISRFYCLCCTRGLDQQSNSILAWLDREAQDAHVAVFPYVLIPFLRALRALLEENGVAISTGVQDTCVSITTKLHHRCIGPAPQKPSNWSRGPIKCRAEKEYCEICAKVNAFLKDARQTEEVFDKKEWDHLPYNIPDTDFKYISGFGSGVRLVKNTREWDDKYRAWKERLVAVRKALSPVSAIKGLYGGRWKEIEELVWTTKNNVEGA
ncbi:MAG: hypothetical protein Q9170_005286 [Blastenia crenularia]